MSYSSSTTACYELTNSNGTVIWSGSASGSASGSTQQDADSSLNSVMSALLLKALSKGLNRIHSSDNNCDTDCNECGEPKTTRCGDCATTGSTTTYIYTGTLTLSTNFCQSDLPYTRIAYVYLYDVKNAECGGMTTKSLKFCIKPDYVPTNPG